MISTFLTSFPLIFEVLVRFKVLSRLQKVMFDGPCNYVCTTLCTHRQRPKHALRPDSTKLLDESDVGARSFEIIAQKQSNLLIWHVFLHCQISCTVKVKKLVKVSYFSLSLLHRFKGFRFSLFLSFSVPKFGFFSYNLSFAKNSLKPHMYKLQGYLLILIKWR